MPRRMTELVYPPDLPQALADCERCFANSLTYSTEYRMQRKDGKLIWVWDTGSKSKNEEGKTVINSVIVDITERRHTNDTIRRQKAFSNPFMTPRCARWSNMISTEPSSTRTPSPSMSSATPKSSSARKPADRS